MFKWKKNEPALLGSREYLSAIKRIVGRNVLTDSRIAVAPPGEFIDPPPSVTLVVVDPGEVEDQITHLGWSRDPQITHIGWSRLLAVPFYRDREQGHYSLEVAIRASLALPSRGREYVLCHGSAPRRAGQ